MNQMSNRFLIRLREDVSLRRVRKRAPKEFNLTTSDKTARVIPDAIKFRGTHTVEIYMTQ